MRQDIHAKNKAVNKLCLRVLKDRAKEISSDDPRIKALEETDEKSELKTR